MWKFSRAGIALGGVHLLTGVGFLEDPVLELGAGNDELEQGVARGVCGQFSLMIPALDLHELLVEALETGVLLRPVPDTGS